METTDLTPAFRTFEIWQPHINTGLLIALSGWVGKIWASKPSKVELELKFADIRLEIASKYVTSIDLKDALAPISAKIDTIKEDTHRSMDNLSKQVQTLVDHALR